MHSCRSLTTGRALTAGLVAQELEEVAGHVDHAGVFVHHDHAARTHDRSGFFEAFKVDGKIYQRFGDAAARRSTGLHRLELPAVRDPAADVEDQLAQSGSHRNLDEACVPDAADQRKDLRPLALLGADAREPLGTMADDLRHGGPGLDVVDAGRLAPQATLGREGRPGPGFAHIPFDRGHERRFLAADEGARPALDGDIEVEAASEDVLPEESTLAGLRDGHFQTFPGQGILLTYVDKTVRRPHRPSPDDHPLDDCVGVGLDDAAIHEGAGVPFVGVADHELDVAGLCSRDLPLRPRGEPGAPLSTQPRLLDLVDDLFWSHRVERLVECEIALAGNGFIDVLRVDQAPVAKRDQLLLLEELNVIHLGDRLGLPRLAIQQSLDGAPSLEMLLHQLRDIFFRYQLIEDVVGLDNHHRSLGTEAVAAGHDDRHLVLKVVPGQLLLQGFLHLE